MYTESVQNTSMPQGMGVKPILIGPLQAFVLKYIPGVFSFAMTIGIQEFFTDTMHDIQLRIKKPDGSILTETITPMMTESSYNNAFELPDDFSSAFISLDVRNLVFECKGIYSTEIIFDKELLGTYNFYVTTEKMIQP